jgi:hypothetical protein
MKTSTKILHWTPRVLCVLAILFISLFAADAFEPGIPITQQLLHFFMHLIPSFILFALLFFAWNRELWGGIIFTALGVVFTPIIFMHNLKMNHSIAMSLSVILMITIPFVVVGLLFIANHQSKKKKNYSS